MNVNRIDGQKQLVTFFTCFHVLSSPAVSFHEVGFAYFCSKLLNVGKYAEIINFVWAKRVFGNKRLVSYFDSGAKTIKI